MLVSVVVPVYNTKGYLPRCLNSIAAQTYREIEVLMIDDGSSDGSEAICDAYAAKDPRFKAIHKPNAGPGPARNTGLEYARGEWISFVDSDDVLHPDFIKLLLEAALTAKAQVAICEFQSIYTDEDIVDFPPQEASLSVDTAEEAIGKMVSGGYISYMTVWKLFKTEFCKKIMFKTQQCEDTEFMSRLLLTIERVAHLDNKLYYYLRRTGSESTSVSFKTAQILTYRDIMKMYQKDLPGLARTTAKLCLRHIGRFYQIKGLAVPPQIKQAEAEAWDVAYKGTGLSLERIRMRIKLSAPGFYAILLKIGSLFRK